MSGNQGSNPERGYQRTYEERSASIQQHIRHLLDEHGRIGCILRESRPSGQDDVTRLVQLHAKIRPLTQLIKDYILEYLRTDTEWSCVISQFRLHVDRSGWGQEMLQQRNTFFHGLSLAVTPLDYLFAQLLQDAHRTLADIETFIQAASPQDVQSTTAANAPQDLQARPGPAHSAGSVGPTHSVGDPSAAQNSSRPPHSGARNSRSPATSNPTTTSAHHPHPADQHHRRGTSRTRASNFVNSSRRRSGTTGIMSVTEGNVADAIPLAWHTASDSESQRGATQFYSVAPPTPSRPTHSVGVQTAAEAPSPTEPPRPPRIIDPEHKRRLQRVLMNAQPGGREPSQAPSLTPLGVGADGQPFNSNSPVAAAAATSTATDFGDDFARENSSSFYRNAHFARRPAQASTSHPPLMLREIPLTPFNGDIRSYPEFRNRFLETVEAHRNLEPRHKLQLLLQHLNGPPRQMAEGFPITDESYFEVTELLEQKYGNKTMLMNLLTQDIIDLPSPQMKREELQLFHDQAFRTISNLRRLGPGSGPDNLLVQILIGKLPPAMKLKLIEKSDYATLDANAVLKGIRDHVSLQDRALSAGLTLRQGPSGTTTTLWSHPPGSFNEQIHPRGPGRPNPKSASNVRQFYVADIVTSNVTPRINNVQKKNKCLPSLEEDHGRLSCPQVNGHLPNTSRRPCNLQDHSLVEGWKGQPATLQAPGEGGSPNSLTRRFRCDLPADRIAPLKKEPPTVPRMRSAKCEAGNSDPARVARTRKTTSTKRTASRRGGTPRPTTSSNERTNPQGAAVLGDDGSLPGHRQTLSADDSSTRTRTTREFSRATPKPGTLRKKDDSFPAPDPSSRTMEINDFQAEDEPPLEEPLVDAGAVAQRFPRSNEETLIQKPLKPQRRRVVSKPLGVTSNRFNPDLGAIARHTLSVPTAPPNPVTLPAVLLECVETLASAPNFTGSSRPYRDVIVFFDSGCTDSCVSRQLVELLLLPQREPRKCHVNCFGTRSPVAIEGIDTTITLWTTDSRPITFDAIALETIAPSVTTALVEETDLPLLNSGHAAIRPLRLTPDILIGQDLAHLFDRQDLPRLPHGFKLVRTNLGMTIAGAGQPSFASGSDAVRQAGPGPSSRLCDGDSRTPLPNPIPTRSDHSVAIRTHPPRKYPAHFAGPTTLQTTEASNRTQRLCPLCDNPHLAINCTNYTSVSTRLRRVKKLHLCLVCLRNSHLAPDCPLKKKGPCRVCQHGCHHRIVCKGAATKTTANIAVQTSAKAERTLPKKPMKRGPLCRYTKTTRPRKHKNPLDTTEPLLVATSATSQASSANSAPATVISSRTTQKKANKKRSDATSSVQRTPNSRKTRLRFSSVFSGELGNLHPRKPSLPLPPNSGESVPLTNSRGETSTVSRNFCVSSPPDSLAVFKPLSGSDPPPADSSASTSAAHRHSPCDICDDLCDFMRQAISRLPQQPLEAIGSRSENFRQRLRSPQPPQTDATDVRTLECSSPAPAAAQF